APYTPYECCFKCIERPLRLSNLVGCYSTPRECFTPATVFETKRGDKICANPEDKWVKRAVRELQKRQRLRA
ncbi:CCL14 protein, partial [Paradoxornis webbianus]|nr:CCL14 protein [Sinosuthora webbiana]